MKYKSPYRVILKIKEKELNEKRKEIAELTKKKGEKIEKIKKETQKMVDSMKKLEEGFATGSHFINGYDHDYVKKLTLEVNDKEQEIREKLAEYRVIKKKKETIIEMDKKKEKEFMKLLRKKEQKRIDSMNIISKIRDEGGV